MLKLCRITQLKVLFPVLVYVVNFDLFEFSAAIFGEGSIETTDLSLRWLKAQSGQIL